MDTISAEKIMNHPLATGRRSFSQWLAMSEFSYEDALRCLKAAPRAPGAELYEAGRPSMARLFKKNPRY
jgi:hypothetical protein